MSLSTYSSLLKRYQQYLDSLSIKGAQDTYSAHSNASKPLSVGIVGGGMAGLYSALLLQNHFPDVKVKIFEADERIGGRVFSYRFSNEPHQFFEAGAMRLPDTESHKPLFQLIDFLNSKLPTSPMKLIEYSYVHPEGNRVLVNGTKQKDGAVMSVEYASNHQNELGFPITSEGETKDAGTLLKKAMVPLIAALKDDFKAALMRYDMSVCNYLSKEIGWSEQKIEFVEVVWTDSSAENEGDRLLLPLWILLM